MASSRWENITISFCYLLSCLAGNVSFYAINYYHRNKPLGMQTLLGKVIVLMVQVCVLSSLYFAGGMIALHLLSPMEHAPALLISLFGFASAHTIILAVTFVVIAKYLSIYHSLLINSVREDTVIDVLRILLLILPWILTLIEYIYFNDIRNFGFYQLYRRGKASPEANVEVTLMLTFFVLSILATILQTRIELDSLKFNDGIGVIKHFQDLFVNHDQPNPGGSRRPSRASGEVDVESAGSGSGQGGGRHFMPIVIRFVFLCLCFLMIVVMVNAVRGNEEPHHSFFVLYISFYSILPWIFVLNHASIKEIIKNSVRSCFCQDPLIAILQ